MRRVGGGLLAALALAACRPGPPLPPPVTTVTAPALAPTPFEYPAGVRAAANIAVQEIAGASTQVIAGRDFVAIANGAPLTSAPEVVEVFSYTCPHCHEFEPLFEAWRAAQPTTWHVLHVPFPRSADDPLERVFYAAQALGKLPQLHARLFDAIHHSHTLRANADEAELLQYLGAQGFDANAFRTAMHAPALREQLRAGRAFLARTQVDSTPTLVVNGQARVLGHSQTDMLRIASALLAPTAQVPQ